MGCGRTRLATAPEIDITLEDTFIPRFDEIVSMLQTPFDQLIAALRVIRNGQRDVFKTYCLIETLTDPSISDLWFVAVLSVASDCHGDFSSIGFSLSAKSPYISITNPRALSHENAERLQKLQEFIRRVEAIPTELKAVEGTVDNAMKRALSTTYAGVNETFKTEVQNSNLGALELGVIKDKFKANIGKIRTSQTLITECIEAANKTLKSLRENVKLLTTHTQIWKDVTPSDLPTLIRTHFPNSARIR